MTRFLVFLAALCLAACSAAPALAETLRANPTTLARQLATAKPGDVVVLDQNRVYGDVAVPVRDHAAPVEIVAFNTKVRSLTFRNTAGWRWLGGTIDSPLPPTVQPFPKNAVWRNAMIDNAHRIEIANVAFTAGDIGVLVTRGSSDVILRGNLFTGLRSDGVNIATATRVSLIGNTCRDFRPISPIWDAAGKVMLKDGTHSDCVMMWSEPGKAPTGDITIIGNRANGKMQGISHFYHPQLGRDKVYRVRVEDNDLTIFGQWHGIMLENTPGSIVRRNVVRTAPGSVAAGRPDLKPKVWVKTDADAVRCGNVVDAAADKSC